jgi:dienelactone hydrolase
MKTCRLLFLIVTAARLASASLADAESPADRNLADYFRKQAADLNARTFAGVHSLGDWTREREASRGQLREMLGLSPLPERTPLHATIAGREEHPEFTVEKLHYQSMPGLYVTANLYVPKQRPEKAPAVLYLVGHSRAREGNVSFGSKVNYHHHGAWFARHGFVCLTIDSIGELAEIEGQHHGTYSAGRWWWNSRGYTPAGVETWNAMRALDYLETRPEVDAQRIGATGRSGGGVGTWWIAALDDRIKVAVPVAGITDLQNYVVDGKVARHCDCMFMVNTYRWDFGRIAALVAPRPLLFSNSDKDDIFPLDGVIRTHREVAAIYKLYGATDKLGLLITEGPHKDTQDLQVPAFRWFNRFLKGEDSLVDRAATKFFTPAELKVFAAIPADEANTSIDATFVPAASPLVPTSSTAWITQREDWMRALREKCFAGWPDNGEVLQLSSRGQETNGSVRLTRWEFTSQGSVTLPLFVFSGAKPQREAELHVTVLDEEGWSALASELATAWPLLEGAPASPVDSVAAEIAVHRGLLERVERGEITLAYLPPRGIGPTAWSGNEREQTQIRRRFMLLGQTLDGMRVWDIRRAILALGQPGLFPAARVHLSGVRGQAVNALYASLFVSNVASLELIAPPASHAIGPDYLNVLKYLDIPQAATLAAERHPVRVLRSAADDWTWSFQAVERLGWPRDRFEVSR